MRKQKKFLINRVCLILFAALAVSVAAAFLCEGAVQAVFERYVMPILAVILIFYVVLRAFRLQQERQNTAARQNLLGKGFEMGVDTMWVVSDVLDMFETAVSKLFAKQLRRRAEKKRAKLEELLAWHHAQTGADSQRASRKNRRILYEAGLLTREEYEDTIRN